VMVTINLPLLIVDFILLAKAGFPPTHYVIGMLWMQLLISLICILPIATLATITASIVQMILAILGIVLYMIGVAALASVIPSSSFSDPADSLELTLLIATCVGVILWQYARRNTVGARWLILALALVVVLIVVAAPYNAILNHEFPRIAASETPPVQLALLPADTSTNTEVPDKEKEVLIQIPLSIAGIPDDSIVVLSGFMVSLEGSDAWRWSSGWKSPGTTLFPDQGSTEISFNLKKKVFERVQLDSVKAQISLALAVYRDQDRREFVVPVGEFVMPDIGFCSAETSYLRGIHCRAALRTPSSIMITSDLAATTCAPREGEMRSATRQISRDWNLHSESGPAELGISPIKSLDLTLWSRNALALHTISGICPGTPLVISSPTLGRRTRMELEFSNLHLADYRVHQVRYGGDGLVFSVFQ